MSNVKLVTITPDAEAHIAYCARVSSSHQDNPEYTKLLKYLIDHQHWSPFEMAHMVVEIETSRAIAAQILRHRSFSFQEFSQRYSSDFAGEFDWPKLARVQSKKNRQSSVELFDDQDSWRGLISDVEEYCRNAYEIAVEAGIAREQARFLLPLAAKTRIYMAGSIRSWIHYCQLRLAENTQQEHRELAREVWKILKQELPTIALALSQINPEIFGA